MKKCKKCNIEKELSDFYNRKSSKDGLHPICKSCEKERHKEYYKANENKIKDRTKKYRKENVNKVKKNQKKHYKANADKIKDKTKEYQKANADKIKEYNKEYRKANADKKRQWQKEYLKANADKYREYYKEYNKERKKTDPLFKFTCNTRGLISNSFKRGINNFTKSKRTEEILGCEIPFFCNYIKGQFKKGMTLENHGEWHLDHINPVSVATTEEEVIELNHYTNFQPLWAVDNLSKNNKLVEKQLKFL